MRPYHLYIPNSYNLIDTSGQSCASKTVRKNRAFYFETARGVYVNIEVIKFQQTLQISITFLLQCAFFFFQISGTPKRSKKK
jgi:hypothetical protein